MKVSLGWLKEYIDIDMSSEELSNKLNLSGTAVESITWAGGDFTGVEDEIFELEITPNRPDCLSMIGIAREVSALTGGKIRRAPVELNEAGVDILLKAKVKIEDEVHCPRYVARVIEGVKIGPSPNWLQKRLKACGIRPINNVVDVTNYVMMEMGQPLHAFDYDKISSGQIIVRRGREGESITTLDGLERNLDPSMLIISDLAGPIALAGVMGGADSEVHDGTKTILLESAHFNAANISRTSRDLGLISESSLRFERGTDPNGADLACDRAAALIYETAGGQILQGRVDLYPKEISPLKIDLRVDRVGKILGTRLDAKEIARILISLEMDALEAQADILTVTVPTFRPDLTREIDLIEEIARIYGYNRIDSTLPKGRSIGGLNPNQKLKAKIKTSLISSGLFETMSYSFVAPNYLAFARLDHDPRYEGAMRLKNPLGDDQAVLRTTLIPSILEVVRWNINRKNDNLKVFEMARGFKPQDIAGLPKETLMVAGALAGRSDRDEWYGKGRAIDFYDVKGIVEKLINDMAIADFAFEKGEHPSLHPSKAVELFISARSAGFFGEIHPKVASAYDFAENVAIFELDVDVMILGANRAKSFKEISRYPGINLDISMLLPEEVSHKEVALEIKKSGGNLLKEVRLFDQYKGAELGLGQKSLAFSLLFQSNKRTLTENEALKARDKIILRLKEAFSATIRE